MEIQSEIATFHHANVTYLHHDTRFIFSLLFCYNFLLVPECKLNSNNISMWHIKIKMEDKRLLICKSAHLNKFRTPHASFVAEKYIEKWLQIQHFLDYSRNNMRISKVLCEIWKCNRGKPFLFSLFCVCRRLYLCNELRILCLPFCIRNGTGTSGLIKIKI